MSQIVHCFISDLIEAGGTNGFLYNDYFAHFKPVSGGTLADWGIAEYPFASLIMAANAIIQNPLKISMLMICPAQNDANRNYLAKTSILTNLQNQIQTHINLGGYFTVVTPAFTYESCLLRNLRDVSPPSDKQVQFAWQWDFEQPLITNLPESNKHLVILLIKLKMDIQPCHRGIANEHINVF